MRVLLLTPDPPAVTHANGGVTRQLHLYRRLIEHGHEVVVVAPFQQRTPDPVAELQLEGFAVRPYLRPKSRFIEVLGAAVRRPALLCAPFRLSFQAGVAAIYWTRLRKDLRATLAEFEFDVVCIEQEFAAGWIDEVPREIPRVLVVQQVESAYREERADRLTGVRRWLAHIDAGRSAKAERRWVPMFDEIVCMTEIETDRLREVVGELPSASALPNGADVGSLSTVGPDPAQERVLFTGTLAFEPNEVAAIWLARKVWPLVLAERPQAQLEIVGRSPSAAVLELGGDPNVSVHADVPDIRVHFEHASICTLPMLVGGGTRLKLAEAFAVRRAVVSTTNGVDGIDVEVGRDVLVADDPAAFAAAIVQLLGDDDARKALAAAGHEFGREHLDWAKLGDQWERTLKQVTGADPLT